MVELRKARTTDTPVCECIICCLGVSEWLYEMVASRSQWWMCGDFPQCTEVSRVKGNGNQQSYFLGPLGWFGRLITCSCPSCKATHFAFQKTQGQEGRDEGLGFPMADPDQLEMSQTMEARRVAQQVCVPTSDSQDSLHNGLLRCLF